ncbi:MAG: preprotein translocase subunit SecE [Sneathiella sp.]|jgi:preprotein translocase subunit SecE|uniref:preprotein translocase subunit SecE n=1 Tax=Sneathiella sp. TaxID=1964365 RepID=UPI000C5F044B|nr:preprotein translocase subunit SecE [Sneathiella sp.]MAL80754.1 preprotein translocase subunit SecE [Sneathiella sp.]|tara:strand:+ start:468 stop:665 length:198 start_codon:yes stop_codon:yes gene_type:complete
MAKVNPGAFIRQVRQEASKVTWPTRKETLITTGMVFVMVFLASMFFFLVDTGIQFAIKTFMTLGS